MACGDLGAYGSAGDGSANFFHSIVVKDAQKISRQRLGTHSPRVGPHHSIAAQHYTRSDTKQCGSELVNERAFLSSGAGTPEADEGHDFGSIRAPTLYRRYTESKKGAEGVKHEKLSRAIDARA
jgi:hypothetical protein